MKVLIETTITLTDSERSMIIDFIEYNKECDSNFDRTCLKQDNLFHANRFAKKFAESI